MTARNYFLRAGARFPVIGAAAMVLSGCLPAFHESGIPPRMSNLDEAIPIHDVLVNQPPNVERAHLRTEMEDNSIWNKQDAIYFRDTRAYKPGDILTVRISINDSARLNNRSAADRALTGSITANASGIIRKGTVPNIDVTGALDAEGERERGGSVNRAERIQLQIAAAIIHAAPNGNLHIIGSQEVRVNHELRVLTVQGVIRAKDILPDNSVPYEKIAEARISYGGNNTRPATVRRDPSILSQAVNRVRMQRY